MMRQQLGLGLGNVRKPRLQHLGNPLMELLPSALQQRQIRRLVNEGVFEEVHRLRWHPALIE
jgi:hypothetical protein